MSALARWARAEWGLLYATVRRALWVKGWRAVPMTLGAVCLTAALQFVQNQSWGYGPVQDTGAVRAEDPLWLALLRTPLSLFVPALDLPVWGALAQVLIVFGIAEICLGWWRTLVLAYVATLAGTLYARSYTIGIDGMTPAEGKALLDFLLEHGHRPEFTFRFRWQKGSIAFWDNRSTKHIALGDTGPFRRLMRRVQIGGAGVPA